MLDEILKIVGASVIGGVLGCLLGELLLRIGK